MKEKSGLTWTARIGGIWYTVIVVTVLGMGHIAMAVHTFLYYDLTLAEGVFATLYFAFAGWLASAFAIGFTKLAIHVELTDLELIAKGLFGQRWRIPLVNIESFRDADIFVKGRKRPIIQIGVLPGGMKSFVEALQRNSPENLVIEVDNLIKQGRW